MPYKTIWCHSKSDRMAFTDEKLIEPSIRETYCKCFDVSVQFVGFEDMSQTRNYGVYYRAVADGPMLNSLIKFHRYDLSDTPAHL